MVNERVDEKKFTELTANSLAVCDFSATWCGPCRMMAPVFEEVSEEYNGKCTFVNVDTDDQPKLASDFRIMYVPTFIVLKNGKELDRVSGYLQKDEFKSFLDKYVKW